jgi:hypothetical protein
VASPSDDDRAFEETDDEEMDVEGIDDGAIDPDDADGGHPPARPLSLSGWGDRIRSVGRSSAAGTSRPSVSTKGAIERLDDRERRFAFAAGAAALVFGIVIYLLETEDKVHFTKNPDAPVTTLILGLVCGGLLIGATLVGRRAPVGFVALFAFLIFGTSSILLGAPFLALAVWLLYRSYKIQRESAARLRASRSGQASSGAPSTRTSTRGGGGPVKSAAPSSKAAPKGRAKSGPVRPEANKRYTPKRPPPPTPKPSRRERKAAKAD